MWGKELSVRAVHKYAAWNEGYIPALYLKEMHHLLLSDHLLLVDLSWEIQLTKCCISKCFPSSQLSRVTNSPCIQLFHIPWHPNTGMMQRQPWQWSQLWCNAIIQQQGYFRSTSEPPRPLSASSPPCPSSQSAPHLSWAGWIHEPPITEFVRNPLMHRFAGKSEVWWSVKYRLIWLVFTVIWLSQKQTEPGMKNI